MLTLRSTLLRVALLYLGAVYGGMEIDDNERVDSGHMSKPGWVTCQNPGGSHVKTGEDDRAERNPGALAEGCSDARSEVFS